DRRVQRLRDAMMISFGEGTAGNHGDFMEMAVWWTRTFNRFGTLSILRQVLMNSRSYRLAALVSLLWPAVVWAQPATRGLEELGEYRLEHRERVNAVACSPDGLLVATGSDRALRVWDLLGSKDKPKPWAEITGLKLGHGGVRALAFAADSK